MDINQKLSKIIKIRSLFYIGVLTILIIISETLNRYRFTKIMYFDNIYVNMNNSGTFIIIMISVHQPILFYFIFLILSYLGQILVNI